MAISQMNLGSEVAPWIHIRLTAFFSSTIRVSRHRKGQTILDFTGVRDDGVAVASAGPYANYLHLTWDITTLAPHHSIFYITVPDALSDAEPTVSEHCRQMSYTSILKLAADKSNRTLPLQNDTYSKWNHYKFNFFILKRPFDTTQHHDSYRTAITANKKKS